MNINLNLTKHTTYLNNYHKYPLLSSNSKILDAINKINK